MEDAKKHGMKIVINDLLPPELNDMTATLTKVKALKPDLLVVSGHSKGAPLVVRQIQEMKITVPMLAVTHCESGKVIEQFGAAADFTLCAAQWTRELSYSDKWFGSALDYSNLFEKEYGEVPPYQAAESSAAVLVYADALSRAGSFDLEKVRQALADTKLQTFYGNVDFDSTGKNTAKPMVLRQIQNGAFKAVAPTKFADTPLIWPIPPWSER